MSSKQIDWSKPVQVQISHVEPWVPAIVVPHRLSGSTHPIGLIFECEPGRETVRWVNESGEPWCGHLRVRNTPAPPVQFEYIGFVNVRCENGSVRELSPIYPTHAMAIENAGNRKPFVCVPVTIRGEWKEDEDAK